MIEATAAKCIISEPKSSAAKIVEAIGELVEPDNTATKPSAAKRGIFPSIKCPKKLPAVEPTNKIGVTNPPLPPNPKVIDVNKIFNKGSKIVAL